jgi:hypothetical protein
VRSKGTTPENGSDFPGVNVAMIIKPSKQFDGSVLPGADPGGTIIWLEYLGQLNWGSGNRDHSSWLSFLRAGSLGIDPDVATQEVTRRIRESGGTFNQSKIQSQLRRAYEHAGNGPAEVGALVRPPKATYSPEKLKAVAAKVPDVNAKYLFLRSPMPLVRNSAMLLNCLYEPGERALVFTDFQSQGQIVFEAGPAWSPPLPTAAEDGAWFLINPIDGEYHPNPRQENKLSRRSEESITSWRYLLLESDVANPNEWLSCLVQLPLKIVAIYTSGGKSIHALVRLDATSKADWDKQRDEIKPIVVTLGADENSLTGVRLSRLPGVRRGQKLQRLLYLNPNATGEPIMNLPTRYCS